MSKFWGTKLVMMVYLNWKCDLLQNILTILEVLASAFQYPKNRRDMLNFNSTFQFLLLYGVK